MNWNTARFSDILDIASHKLSSFGKQFSEANARRTLTKTLLERKKTAREYEQNTVPAGHDWYKLLYEACTADIARFARDYGHDADLILRQYPFLFSLEKKANPKDAADNANNLLRTAFATTAVAALLFLAIGASTGLYQVAQQTVIKIFS